MPDDPARIRSGNLQLPPTTAGMNKIAPLNTGKDDKGTYLGAAPEDEDDAKLLARIRKRMELCVKKESQNRKAAIEDRKFMAGDQWPADVAAQRNTDHRPCLTINKLPTFVNQITNDQRQNRPAINVSPIGDKSDKEAAKMYKGMIRAIERDSVADIAYDTAFSDAVVSGFGYWRILTEYESPDSLHQVIVIKRVRNPFTVYLDPFHQEPDGSDCRYGFITERIPREDFEDEYPDADPVPFLEGGAGESFKDWIGKDDIRIAEYFEIKNKKRTFVKLANGHEGWEDELHDTVKADIKSLKMDVIEERESEVPTVKWYKVNAMQVLAEADWLGQWIPIVKCIGNEIDIEGDVKISGLIRNAKDAQRMMNYWECLDLNTPIPTPDGWVKMGDIHAGSTVFNELGEPVRVLGESPTHINRPCLRVVFDDGTSVVCDHQHQWTVEQRVKRTGAGVLWEPATVHAVDIDPAKHRLPLTKPLKLPEVTLPIAPYVLGVWLGDGTSSSNTITQGEADIEELASHLQAEGEVVSTSRPANRTPYIVVKGLGVRLREAKVMFAKHIPANYLRASEAQRWDLLQGLMDTDGSISGSGQCSFSTIIPALADGFAELVRSLGIKAARCVRNRGLRAMPTGETSMSAEEYQFSFGLGVGDTAFRLARKRIKAERQVRHVSRTKHRKIVRLEAAGSVPVKCIMVDTPSHLFLCGEGMAPTHNTSATELIALAPKAPWLVEEGQIEGHERQWKEANRKSQPFLQYKGTSLAGKPIPPPQRQQFAGVPAGVQQALQNSAEHMIATTGVRFDATKQERMNDESGVAVRELGRKTDLGSFHYVDNLCRSLRHSGRILVDLIPKVYDENRIVTILNADDSEESIRIDPHQNEAFKQEPRGQAKASQKVFNPRRGRYGVTITIGPSFATKRIEAAESMMAFAKAMPQSAQLIADLIAKYQDWEGAEEMAARLAKAVPAQFLTADQKDIPPQVQAMIQNLESQVKLITGQLQGAMKQLEDKSEDRQIAKDKVERDFEAKILAVIQKAEAVQAKEVGSKIDRLADDLNRFIKGVTDVSSASGEASASGASPQGLPSEPTPEPAG